MRWHILQSGRTTNVQLYRKEVETTEHTKTFRSVPAGVARVMFDIEIDWSEVQSMAQRAARSTGKKCKAGPLRVRVTSRIVQATQGT